MRGLLLAFLDTFLHRVFFSLRTMAISDFTLIKRFSPLTEDLQLGFERRLPAPYLDPGPDGG
jgi:hypothetical protein